MLEASMSSVIRIRIRIWRENTTGKAQSLAPSTDRVLQTLLGMSTFRCGLNVKQQNRNYNENCVAHITICFVLS